MKKKENVFRAAIVGAGKIGAFFDTPKSKNILTHAHAYTAHRGFRFVGFVDKDIAQARKAARIWGGRAFGNIRELFQNEEVDVVSVCTPKEEHFQNLMEMAKYSLKGGIVEKPLAHDFSEAQKITHHPYFRNKPFLINYSRRYVPEFQKLREVILSGQYGKFVTGNVYHGRGFFANGSHLLDLLLFFGFTVKDIRVSSVVDDFYKGDPSLIFSLRFRGGQMLTFNIVPASLYRVFELDLFFEERRVRIIEDGFFVEEYEVKPDTIFAGYKKLYHKKRYETALGQHLYLAVRNLHDCLTRKGKPFGTIHDGFYIQKLCENIWRKRKKR